MALTEGIQTKASAKDFRGRLFIVALTVIVAFSALLSRLYYVQVLRGEEFANRGRNNFIHKIRTPHDRGIVYDRYGEILIDNRPSLDVQVTPYFLGSTKQLAKETLQELFDLVDVSGEEREKLANKIVGQRGLNRFRPVMVKRDVSRRAIAAVEAERGLFKLNGVEILPGRRRNTCKALWPRTFSATLMKLTGMVWIENAKRAIPRNTFLETLLDGPVLSINTN